MLQNQIVDPRFAATGFRDFQNYIGQTVLNYEEIIYYVCPPPEFLSDLMKDLINTAIKMKGVNICFFTESIHNNRHLCILEYFFEYITHSSE